MKRLLLLAGLVLLLGACGNDDPEEDVMSQVDDEEELDTSTEDPLEIVTNDEYDTFIDGFGEYEVIGKYTTGEENEDGFIELSKDGYTIKFAMLLVNNIEEDTESVYMVGEHENNNQDGGGMGLFESDVKTNEKEVLTDAFGTDFIAPDTREKFAYSFNFEYDTPDSFEITLKEPIDKEVYKEEMLIDGDEPDDWEELEFTKE